MADQTNLPNAFLSIFTPAELRVIRAIFAAISAEGRCTKRLDEIAAMASASLSKPSVAFFVWGRIGQLLTALRT
jgi:hypothetical protein